MIGRTAPRQRAEESRDRRTHPIVSVGHVPRPADAGPFAFSAARVAGRSLSVTRRYHLPVMSHREPSQVYRVDADPDGPDAPVAEHELAHAGVVAAEPAGVERVGTGARGHVVRPVRQRVVRPGDPARSMSSRPRCRSTRRPPWPGRTCRLGTCFSPARKVLLSPSVMLAKSVSPRKLVPTGGSPWIRAPFARMLAHEMSLVLFG